MRACYILHLRPLPSDTQGDEIRRLRAALKVLLRSHGLECVWAADRLGRPLDRDDHGSGDPAAMALSLSRQFRLLADLLEASDLPIDGADDVAVSLASLGEQVDALRSRLLASSVALDGTRRPNSRPRRRKPRAGR